MGVSLCKAYSRFNARLKYCDNSMSTQSSQVLDSEIRQINIKVLDMYNDLIGIGAHGKFHVGLYRF